MTTTDTVDHGARIIAQSWMNEIQKRYAEGDYPGTLYVSLGDWNRVATSTGLPPVEAKRLPQIAQFMDNPVMIVPELPDGLAYLGKRIMP